MLDYVASNLSSGNTALLLFIFFVIYCFTRTLGANRQVKRLGCRAPLFSAWPSGLDFIYKGVKFNLQYRNIELWKSIFASPGVDDNGTGTWTSEITVFGTQRIIWTVDPENTKAILTSQFADYGKGERFHEDWKPFLGDGIFGTDGDKWHFARQLLRPMFSRDRVVEVESFEPLVQKFIKHLGGGGGEEVEVSQLLFRYTLDAATDFLLGAPVGSLDDENNDFAQWFGNIQYVQSLITRSGPLRSLVYKGRYHRDIRKMEAFLDPIIAQALALSADELDHKLIKSDTFLHQLARATRDPKVIRDQLVTILLAGRDTTACTLSWTFFELARHPEVTARLRKEIINHVGPDSRTLPTYNDIKDMRYLTWVINETLRRYPVVPFNLRAALKDTTLPHGGGPDGSLPIGVVQGDLVAYSPLVMHRRRDLYPPVSESSPDPDQWAPDRWATWTPKPWQYIPFNGGPRICIGQQFAMAEMGYTICRVLQHFDHVIELGQENQEVLKCEVVLIPAKGIKLGFQKAA